MTAWIGRASKRCRASPTPKQVAPVTQRSGELADAISCKPTFLTAAASVIGVAFIAVDSIFHGLAISPGLRLDSSTAHTVRAFSAAFFWLPYNDVVLAPH